MAWPFVRLQELGAVQRTVDLEGAIHSVNFEEMKQFVKGQPWRKRPVRRQLTSPSHAESPGQPAMAPTEGQAQLASSGGSMASLESSVAEHNRVLAKIRKVGPKHFAFPDLQHEQQSLFAKVQAEAAAIGGRVQLRVREDDNSVEIVSDTVDLANFFEPEPARELPAGGVQTQHRTEQTSTALAPPAEGGQEGGALERQDSDQTQKKLYRRHKVIMELLSTEQRYGEKLELMNQGYFQPLSRKLPEADIRAIFSSFPAILQCQKKFYGAKRPKSRVSPISRARLGANF